MSKSAPKKPRKYDRNDQEPDVAMDIPPGPRSGFPQVFTIRGRELPFLKVFDPAQARSRLEAANGMAQPDDSVLVQMAEDKLRGLRRLSLATSALVDGLVALKAEMPNFDGYLSQIEASARASLHAQVPLTLPPTILVGPPGTGKTRLCRRLSEILAVPFERISMPSLSGGHPLSGTDSTWKSSRPGIIAEKLVKGSSANPLILLDEIDKCAINHEQDHPLDVLHELWEAEGAARFKDDCLKVSFDASAIFWVCTANEIDDIRSSLLDRAQVIAVSTPSPEQMGAIILCAYTEQAARWRSWFSPRLKKSVIDRLRTAHPRLVHRILQAAMTQAAAHARREVTKEDVDAAMAWTKIEDRPRMGFL